MLLNQVKHVVQLSMFLLVITGYLYSENLQCYPFNTTWTSNLLFDTDFVLEAHAYIPTIHV